MKLLLRTLPGIVLVWAIYFLRAHSLMLFYPVAVVAAVLGFFVYSLFHVPVAELFARRLGENLDRRGIAYCRKATIAWTIFLAAHLAVTLATVFAPRGIWALYNGLIAYLLLALMFGGEYLVRRKVRRG